MQAHRRVVRAICFAPTHTPRYLPGGTARPKWYVHGTTVAKGAGPPVRYSPARAPARGWTARR
eukprot:11191539-Lingulodinium_polyedra.AAC.1